MPFTHVSNWSDPAPNLSPDDYAKVCLMDLNAPGAPKTKANCKLPVKKTPDGPYVIEAIHAAAGAHGIQGVQAPADKKRQAASKLVSLYSEMGEVAPEAVYRIAGKQMPKGK
jgi:hypothetical protein